MRKLWKRLFGMALCLCAAVCLMSVSASAAEHSHPVCGKTHTAIGDHTGTCNDVIWTEVTQDNVSSDGWLTLAGGESYYLGTNIAISNYITITGTVNLCLNGHSITDNGNLDIIRINPTGILTLCDCNGDNLTHTFRLTGQKWDPVDSAGSDTIEVVGGVITHTAGTNGGGVQINGGTLNLYGGSIIGSQYNDAGGGVCVTKGIFNLYGGHVTRNSGTAGGGVNVGDYYGRNSATFNMYNGTISCNTSDMRGGGVCVSKNSTFNMFNGTISGNRGSRGGSQDYGGGGVVVRGGDFLMSGGTISGNSIGDTSRGYGGGVYVYDGTFTISGNVTIKNNFRGGTLSGNVYSGGTANNVCLFDNKKITIGDALTSTDPIGVTTTTAPTEGSTIPFATAADNRITENTFTSDNRLYVVEVGTDGKSALLKVCPHTGNNNTPATCIAKAVCGTCGQEYGDLDPSNHAGALGTVWKFDGTNHWKEYTCCHARADEGNHQWDEGRETKSPTCTAEGEKTYTCSVCSGTKTEQIDALGHDFENGTWQSDEDEHWKKCSRCDVTDEANKAPHSGGTATCQAKAVCETCGTAYGALDGANHSGALGVWQSDENNHWKEYSCCHVRADVGSHHWDEGRETKSPTCTEDGVKTFTCSQCNNTKTEPISALGHDFENGTWQSDGDHHWKKCSRCDVTDEANKAPHSGGTATCQAKAVCETCGTAYGALDANNHIGVLGVWQSNEDKHWKEYSCCQVHANEGNHQWDEGRETKSPTCTTAGEKTYICTDCGRTKTEQIDALGHDWGEWVVTKPATTSAAGEETRVCKRNASHTETRAIPKLTPAPSGGGSSSGSGGAPTVTVPVSGSGDTVHVSASVSGSTAEVKEIKSAELDKIGTDSTVVIDLSGLNKGVTGVTLSTDTIDSICKTEADGVTIKLPNAELRVDRQTLAAVTEQAAGSKIRLVVEPDSTARNTMTAAQRSTLAGMKNAAALEAYFVSNDTRIHDFKGGSVELSIPYRAEGAIRAWFLKEDGTREPVSARYDKENAQLILHHFSHYVIEELDSSAAYTVCAKDDSCPLGAFGDLTAAAWYHDGVHYCLENGLMRGVSGGKFLPDGSTTRAQLVTILWRLEGSPEPADTVSFGDIADGAWYAKAVRWAAGSGVVKGYGNGNIGPDDAVTREQMVTILYRFAQHKGYDVSAGEDTNILSFNDTLTVSEYAIPAMQWACGSGMVNGIAQEGEMFLAPKDTTTRAQIATLMMRFQGIFTTAV